MPNKSAIAKCIGCFFYRDDISSLLHKISSRVFQKGSSPSRTLIYSIGEAFYLFKEENAHLEVSLTEFAEYLPNRIILANVGEQCLCFCCENINKVFLTKAFHDQTGNQFQTLADLIKTLVCDPSNEACMRHQCTECNIYNNLLTVIENSFDYCKLAYFSCQQWNSHRLEVEYLTQEVLASKFLSQMMVYADHVFISQQQSEKLSSQISSLRAGEIIYMMNVASLSFGFKHILKRDISFLTGKKCKKRKMIDLAIYDVIVYYNNFGQISKLSYVTLTNNSQCTAYDIWTFNSYIFNDLKKRSIKMNSVILWSNSDKRYFKNAESLAIFTHMHMFGTTATWNFHFSNHDRYEHDCATAIVKKYIWECCRDNYSTIENAKDIASKIEKNVLPVKLLYVSKKDVSEHKEVFEKISDKVHPIAKLQSALTIIPVGSYSIDVVRSVLNPIGSRHNIYNIDFTPTNMGKFPQKTLAVDGIITDCDHKDIIDYDHMSNRDLTYPAIFVKPSTPTHCDLQDDLKPSVTYSADSYEYCRMRLVYNSRRKDLAPIVTNEIVATLLENLQNGPINFKTELKEEDESVHQDIKSKVHESCDGVYIKQEITNEHDETEQDITRHHHDMSSNVMKDPIFVAVNHEELFTAVNKGDDSFLNASSSNSSANNSDDFEHMSKEAIEKINDEKFREENPDLVQEFSNGNYEGSFFTKTLRKMRLQKEERIKRTIEKVIADVTKGLPYSEDGFDSDISDEKVSKKKITNISSDASYKHSSSVRFSVKDANDKKGYGKATSFKVVKEGEAERKSTINSPLDAVDIDAINIKSTCNTEEKMNISNGAIYNTGDKSLNNSINETEITMNSKAINVQNTEINTGVNTDESKNTNSPTSNSSEMPFCGSIKKNINFHCDTMHLDDQSTHTVQLHLKSKCENFRDSDICSDKSDNRNLTNDDISHISSVGTSDQRIFNVLRQFRKPKSESKVESLYNENSTKLTNISETGSVFTVKCEDDNQYSPATLTDRSIKKRKREIKILKLNYKKKGRKRKEQKLMDATEYEQECNQEFLVKDELNRTEGIIKRRSSRSKEHTEISDLYERSEIDGAGFDDSLQSDTDDLHPTKDMVENDGLSESGIARHFLEELVDDMEEESCCQNESDLDEDWEDSTQYLKHHEAQISLKKTDKSDELEKNLSDQDDGDDEELSEKPILDEDGSLLRDLNAILDAENDDNPFQCPDCEQVLSSRGNLKRHVNTIHRGLRPFMCPECSASFSEKRSMELHIVNVHDQIRPYICSDCGKSYSNKTSLSTHIKSIHVGLKPYPCTECEPNRYFARLPCLKIHNERWHNPSRDPPSYIRDVVPRNYSCPICQSSFSSTNAVKKHVMFVHEKLKAFQCSICLSNFRDYGNLRRHHTAIHEGIKPYKCDECPTTFCDKWGLQKHKENIHMGVKKHICHVCHFPFSEKSNMLRHFATVHKGVKPFECKDCDTKYTQKASLKHHLAVVHNKTIEEAVSEGQLTPNFGNPINESV